MSVINEKNFECCNSAVQFKVSIKTPQLKKSTINMENSGFFEKLFNYLNKK